MESSGPWACPKSVVSHVCVVSNKKQRKHVYGTWMSQEVSKWLVNGLKPTYKWGILGP